MRRRIRTIILAVILAVPAFFVTVKKPTRIEAPELAQYEEEPEEPGGEGFGEQSNAEQLDEEQPDAEQSDAEQTDAEQSDEEPYVEQPAEEFTEEPQTKELSFEPMLINPGEAVVYNYSELKNALEQDNGITTVYFGGDIIMQLGGVRINPNKRNVTVSGLNPNEPERKEPYTLTEYSSASFYNAIYVDAAGVNILRIRDMNITGKNYYGPFSVLDSSSLADILLIYDNVRYNGPQMCYHRQGTVYVINSTANIHGGNGGSVNQEFSEAKHLVFRGTNTITTESSANTVFWHPLGGSFVIEDDSALNVNSPNTSVSYGVFFADSYTNKVSITIGERAAFELTVSGAVAPEIYVTLDGFTVREGGSFNLKTTKAATVPVLRLGGALTIEPEGSFIITGYGGASVPLLRQTGGDITVMRDGVFRLVAQSGYSELINLAGSAFICNNPASVLLYNEKRDITASQSPGRIFIDAQQVNYWNTINSGGLDAPESVKWYKQDGTNFALEGTLQTGAGGEFSAITSNYADGDSPGTPPSAGNFSMAGARVLAFGWLEIALARPAANAQHISGVTRPGAVVRVSFTQEGTDYILPDTTAGSDGVFSIPTGTALREGTVINAACAWQYLTASDRAVVAGSGGLEFFVPDTMEFFVSKISAQPQTVKRLHPGWEIVVSDSRGPGGGWRIYAQLSRELTPAREDLSPLTGAFVFREPGGGQFVMSPGTPTLIAAHTTGADDEIYPVAWREDEGVLLHIKPGTVYAGMVYSSEIVWTLVNGP